jgi:hypothetical protein
VPDPDSRNLLSWDSATSDNDKIRFFVPVTVLLPGTSEYQTPPTDLLAYLLGQAEDGAVFTDRAEITVGGRAATIFTATTPTPLSDSISCAPLPDGSQACFGFLPDGMVPMGVIDLGEGRTLLSWARMASEAPKEPFRDLFERMLATVRFDDGRAPTETLSPTPAASATLAGPIADGSYSTGPFPVAIVRAAIGTFGMYSFPDEHTLRYVDQDGSVHLYAIDVTADSFIALVDEADLAPSADPIGPLWNVAPPE